MLLTNYSSPDPTERLIAIEGVVGTTSDFLPASVFCVGGLVKKKKKRDKHTTHDMLRFLNGSFHISRLIPRFTSHSPFNI